jgi:Nif-specific regulatory protein
MKRVPTPERLAAHRPVETASEGTVFLDEIGEISPGFQAKLLRVLECGEYSRIGSVETRRTNVRIIAATNRNLKQMIRDGRFREDLYYRLSVFPIQIPPLRSRMMIFRSLWIISSMCSTKNTARSKTGVSDIALTLLFRYNYPATYGAEKYLGT